MTAGNGETAGRASTGRYRPLSAGVSKAKIHSDAQAGGRWRGDLGDTMKPGGPFGPPSASEPRSVRGKGLVAGVAEVGEFGVDGAEPRAGQLVFDVPLQALAEFGPEFLDGLFAGGDLGFSLADFVDGALDPVDGSGFVLATVTAKPGERPELLEVLAGVIESAVGHLEFPSRVFEGEFRLAEGRVPVGWPVLEEGAEFGAFGQQPFQLAGGFVNGEAGVGFPPEGVEHGPVGGALVGEDAAVVEFGEEGDVPGVGGVPGAALADVAGVAVQGGGAEEVDLGPGAALDAVDGAGPGVGAVGAAVGAVALRRSRGGASTACPWSSTAGARGGDGGDGDDGAVVEPPPVGRRVPWMRRRSPAA